MRGVHAPEALALGTLTAPQGFPGNSRPPSVCSGAARGTARAPSFHNPPFEPAGSSARGHAGPKAHERGGAGPRHWLSPAAFTPQKTAHFQSPRLENESPSHHA